MRVLLIWTAATRLTDISVRYERYARGLRALGHDPVTVCLASAAEGYAEPIAVAPDPAAFRDPDFYRKLDAGAAIVVTWLGLPEVVAAAQAGCGWVTSVADSDGQIGPRAHPWATLARAVMQHTGWGTRLRALKYWLALYAGGPNELDDPVLASAAAADRVAVCSPVAVGHLRRFFNSYRRLELGTKVVSVPYPIDECYLTEPVPIARADRVVAIGRWDDPQKDAGLLCRVAERHRRGGRRTEFHVFGLGGERLFAPLARRNPFIVYHGSRPPGAIAGYLRESRALLLTSRWESGPIVLSEALASGCTVVSTDAIPAAVSAVAEGPFGIVSTGRSATGLASALSAEMTAWDRGDRDPVRTAAHWRPQFEPATVCSALLPNDPMGKPV